jgi:hypothetical protein
VIRRTPAPLALAVFAAFVAGFRVWGALAVETPWIFIDELLHWELAESLAAGDGFTVRGEHVDVGYVYPLLLAGPAAAFESFDRAYDAAKVLNVALTSAAVVPLYLWARRFLEPWPAAIGAGLGLLVPSLALSGTLMTENLFFPGFLLAAWAIALAVEQPTVPRQLFALAAIALAVATRFQGIVLLAVYATAVPLSALLARRRVRDAAYDLLRHRVADIAVGVGALAFLAAKLSEGAPSSDWLGFYTQVVDTDYTAGEVLRWLVRSAGELALVVGVLPIVAFATLLAGRGRGAAERAFLAITAATGTWLVLVGGVAGEWPPPGVKERYLFYAAPLLLIALVLWVDRGAPRPRVTTAVAGAATALLVAALPLGALITASGVHANAIGLLPLARIAGATSTNATRVLLAAGAIAAVALVLRPRLAVPAVAVFLAVSSAAAYGPIHDRAREVQRLAGGADREWIDADRVTLVNLSSFVPETARGDFFPLWVPFWTAEIWNDAHVRVVSVGELEPAPTVEYPGTIDWATGRIGGAGAGPALVDARFELAGRLLARSTYLALYDVAPPVRLAAAIEGVYRDGTTGSYAAYDRWEGGTGTVEVVVTPPAPAEIRIGPLTVASGVPALAPDSAATRSTGAFGAHVRTPFRIEVRLGADSAGRRVSFRFRPAR